MSINYHQIIGVCTLLAGSAWLLDVLYLRNQRKTVSASLGGRESVIESYEEIAGDESKTLAINDLKLS